MRAFLGIEISKSVQTKLQEQLTQLMDEYPQFSWVAPENYHLTIQFLGEVEDVKKLTKKIEDVVYDIPAFHLYSFGAALSITHRITLYVEFNRQKVLESIVERVKSIPGIPAQSQSKFMPHLTFAKSKVPSKQQYFLIKKKLEQLDIDIDFPVKKIFLYQSILQAQAPLYKKIAEFPLVTE